MSSEEFAISPMAMDELSMILKTAYCVAHDGAHAASLEMEPGLPDSVRAQHVRMVAQATAPAVVEYLLMHQ